MCLPIYLQKGVLPCGLYVLKEDDNHHHIVVYRFIWTVERIVISVSRRKIETERHNISRQPRNKLYPTDKTKASDHYLDTVRFIYDIGEKESKSPKESADMTSFHLVPKKSSGIPSMSFAMHVNLVHQMTLSA